MYNGDILTEEVKEADEIKKLVVSHLIDNNGRFALPANYSAAKNKLVREGLITYVGLHTYEVTKEAKQKYNL